jgi:predicted dehydrogenase
VDGAVHNYDFALQMFGAATSVQASSLQFDSTSVGADTATAVLNFSSGDQHTLVWTWGLPVGTRSAGLRDIIGPHGCLQFGMTAATPPKNFDAARQGAFTLQRAGAKTRVYPFVKNDMFVAQLKHVVGCFGRDEPPLVTGADGIAALRVALAVLKSGSAHKTVSV